MAKPKLILDYVYDHEAKLAERVYLTQPVGGDKVIDYTWKQTLDQSRRMAAHIKAQGLEPGARVAILSKNCAHFFMAELAIWMAGCTTVALFPTETAETISYVLEHSTVDWPRNACRHGHRHPVVYLGLHRHAKGCDAQL